MRTYSKKQDLWNRIKLAAILIGLGSLIMWAVSCHDVHDPLVYPPLQPDDMGCITAIPKNGTDRVLICCCSYGQFDGGKDSLQNWNEYTEHQWRMDSACTKCR